MIFPLIFLKYGVANVLSKMAYDKGLSFYYEIHTQNILFIINRHVESCLVSFGLFKSEDIEPNASVIVELFKSEIKTQQNKFIEKVEHFAKEKLLKGANDTSKFNISDFNSLFVIDFWKIVNPYPLFLKLINNKLCCSLESQGKNLKSLKEDTSLFKNNLYMCNERFLFKIFKKQFKDLEFKLNASHFKCLGIVNPS